MAAPFRAPALIADADPPELFCVCADCGCARCLTDLEFDEPGRQLRPRPTAALPPQPSARYPSPP